MFLQLVVLHTSTNLVLKKKKAFNNRKDLEESICKQEWRSTHVDEGIQNGWMRLSELASFQSSVSNNAQEVAYALC